MKDKKFIEYLIKESKILNQYIEETALKYRVKNKLEKTHIAFIQSINKNIEDVQLSKFEKEELFKTAF